jgi:RimJ/RimL family protein N-acetyltransferase
MRGAGNPIVRGEKVWLRRFEKADISAYKAAVNDANIAFWAGYVSPQNDVMVERFFDKRASGDEYFFVISPLGSDDFIGTIWLWNKDSRLGGIELSMFIVDPGNRGRGLGTDAINAMLDFGFGNLDIHRIWLTTLQDNEPAHRAFQRTGFVEEGTVRGHYLRNGRRLDSVQMSILRPDWDALDRPRSWELDA